ncbi:MAG: cache domain-containing protein [Smithellaceae bacterium]|nr:cache domain-containing protein [Smithellaceae bacterium]
MKKVLMTALVAFLCMGVFCLSAFAQTQAPANVAAQDLLIKSEVETAISLLQAIQIRHQRGEMTLEKAKQLGAGLLRELRYGTDGYFWADTTEGINVVLYGRKDVEGRNRIKDKDAKGVFYVKEFLAKGKAGGGYVEYQFTKKGQTTAQPKRSYVLPFEPFGWVVGTGYYR